MIEQDTNKIDNDVNLAMSLTYNTEVGNLGYYDTNQCWIPWVWTTPTHYVYTNITTVPNKFELAFKIVSKLLEKKIIDNISVKKFIELINEIVGII